MRAQVRLDRQCVGESFAFTCACGTREDLPGCAHRVSNGDYFCTGTHLERGAHGDGLRGVSDRDARQRGEGVREGVRVVAPESRGPARVRPGRVVPRVERVRDGARQLGARVRLVLAERNAIAAPHRRSAAAAGTFRIAAPRRAIMSVWRIRRGERRRTTTCSRRLVTSWPRSSPVISDSVPGPRSRMRGRARASARSSTDPSTWDAAVRGAG